MTGRDEPARRHLTGQDEDKALGDLRAWFRDHPDVTDPGVAVKALGLPGMDGIPADPKKRSRTQWRMYRDAETIRQFAGYAMRHEAGLRGRAGAASAEGGR